MLTMQQILKRKGHGGGRRIDPKKMKREYERKEESWLLHQKKEEKEEEEDDEEEGEGEEAADGYKPHSSSDNNPSSQRHSAKKGWTGNYSFEPSDPQVWIKYWHQIRESEGFDIVDSPHPDEVPGGSIVPVHDFREDGYYQYLVKLAELALAEYNKSTHGEKYRFISVEKANVRWGFRHRIYYITFRAQKQHIRTVDGGEIFQAKVLVDGPKGDEVYFCRLKPRIQRVEGEEQFEDMEREGFDIDVKYMLPVRIKRPKVYEHLVELAQLAMTEYNRSPHRKSYRFIFVEKANVREQVLFPFGGRCEVVKGDIYYITFRAQKMHTRAVDGDDAPLQIFLPNPPEIFQAEVWCPENKNNVVFFCRRKPPKKLYG